MYKRYFLYITFFFCSYVIFATSQNNPIQIDSLQNDFVLHDVSYLSDTNATLTLENIIVEDNWNPSLPIGLRTGTADLEKYWVKLSFISTTNTFANIIFTLPAYKITNVYCIQNTKVISTCKGGILQKQKKIFMPGDEEYFNIQIPPSDTTFLYFELINASQTFSPFHLSIKEIDTFIQAEAKTYYSDRKNILWNAAFLGIMLFQLIYLYFQWMWIRKKEYIFYIIYIIIEGIYFLNKMEYTIDLKILYSYFPALSVYFDRTLPVLSIYFYYRFARYFIDLPQKMPLLNKRVKILENIMLFYSIADFIFIVATYNLKLEALFINLISLIVFVASLYIIISFLKQRMVLYYFIIAGSLFLLFGSIGSLIVYNIANAGHNIGFNPIIILQISFVLEIFCFTTGLAYKARLDAKEKIIAQEQLIHELKEKDKLQIKMQGIRDKIARDLHDDIGATLGSISFYSKAALKQIDNKNKIEEIIHKIEDSARETVDHLSDVVWAVNTQNDSAEQLINRMQKFSYQLLSPYDIQMHFTIDEKINETELTMEMRKNIFLIYKEAIHNIAKYAVCKNVFVYFQKRETLLSLEIRDDGIGFDITKISAYNGNGLKNMQQRAKEIQSVIQFISENGKGTTIKCTIPVLPNVVID